MRLAQSCGVGHVRVKRGSETFFVIIDVEGGATAGELRAKTAHMMSVDLSQLRLCLFGAEDLDKIRYFRDDEKLQDRNVATDDVVCAVLRDGDSNWERPHFLEPPPIEADVPSKGLKGKS